MSQRGRDAKIGDATSLSGFSALVILSLILPISDRGMRGLGVLLCLVCLALCDARPDLQGLPKSNLVPVQVFGGTDFDIPPWLGVYLSYVGNNCNWTLPLTYKNNGTVPAGLMLWIRNYVSSTITLRAQGSDYIDYFLDSFNIGSGEAVQVVSGDGFYSVLSMTTF